MVYRVTGDTSTGIHLNTPSCNTEALAPELLYKFRVPANARFGVDIRVGNAEDELDTVLELRKENCTIPEEEFANQFGTVVGCADDSTPPGHYGSRVEAIVHGGPNGTDYFILVSGYCQTCVGPLCVFFLGACPPASDLSSPTVTWLFTLRMAVFLLVTESTAEPLLSALRARMVVVCVTTVKLALLPAAANQSTASPIAVAATRPVVTTAAAAAVVNARLISIAVSRPPRALICPPVTICIPFVRVATLLSTAGLTASATKPTRLCPTLPSFRRIYLT